jgi:hypothetical protein
LLTPLESLGKQQYRKVRIEEKPVFEKWTSGLVDASTKLLTAKTSMRQDYESGDNFWICQQAQRGPKPWLMAQSVILIASAGFFGDPVIPLALEKSSHVPPVMAPVGPR